MAAGYQVRQSSVSSTFEMGYKIYLFTHVKQELILLTKKFSRNLNIFHRVMNKSAFNQTILTFLKFMWLITNISYPSAIENELYWLKCTNTINQ